MKIENGKWQMEDKDVEPVAKRLSSKTLRRLIHNLQFAIAFLVLVIAATALAQRSPFMRREFRPELVDRNGVPEWKNDERFKSDVFTFVRVRYSSGGYGRSGGNWHTDYPDSDLNFSYRLHELTALETDPNGKILELTDEALFDYPWIYIIEPGRMSLTEAEVAGLRKYLLNGGFLMVDDFWGEHEWQNFYENIKRVFPDREPVELPLEHEIFHCVYDLKKKPQVPSIGAFQAGYTTERQDAPEAHYRAIFDDKGRMMAIICHNTDLGDGWEREGEDPTYFREMAEKWSYPMGINIVTYAMTH
ncbi:MAG: DUF4159 domain-containing protein [Planctomycetaceae bacterium]